MGKYVTLFGTSKVKEGDSVFSLAEETGLLLAQAGYTIVNGGYGGTMLAAGKGAAQANGEVIGITCSAFKRSKPNQYVTREVLTHSLDERLDKLIELGQAYIVFPGGTGTLLELAKVWELQNKGFIEKKKPIIIMGKFWSSLIELLSIDDPKCVNCITIIDEPKQVVEILK